MNDFLRWLLDNGPSIALIMIAVTVILMYLVASFQRRAVSFWPPRIEGRPLDTSNRQDSSTSVIYAIQNRKSVRTFLDRPVEEEKLNRVLEAARLAPSASNRQEWRFVIIRGKATRKKIGTATSMVSTFVEKSPVLIAACAETDGHVMQCGQFSYPIDVAIALDHLSLAAVELGLGTCWVAMFDEEKVKKFLGIPDVIRVLALMPLGYPVDPSAVEKKRLPMEKIVKYEHW